MKDKINNNGTSKVQEDRDYSVTTMEQPSEKPMAAELATVEIPKPVVTE